MCRFVLNQSIDTDSSSQRGWREVIELEGLDRVSLAPVVDSALRAVQASGMSGQWSEAAAHSAPPYRRTVSIDRKPVSGCAAVL